MLAAAGEVTVVKLGGSFVQRYDSTATYVVELLNVNKFDNILNGLLNAKAEKMLLNTESGSEHFLDRRYVFSSSNIRPFSCQFE